MTRNLLLLSICLLVVGPLVAVAEELDGGEVYAKNCGNCHNFRPPGEKGDREWEMAIGHMRSVAELTGSEARAVVKFLEYKNPEEPKTVRKEKVSGPILSGAELVAKGACRACHVIGDSGGKVGPSLNGVFSRRSRDYIVTQITDPRSHNASSIMPVSDFSQAELENLVKYLADNS